MAKKKQSQSEIDGVQYRRSKTWQIALAQMNSASAMCFYILIGYASYVGNVGYGVATALIGLILTATRVLDGITDPLIALLIDKTNTRFGKMRLFMAGGWIIEAIAVFAMFNWFSGKGHGVFTFVLLYILYVIGYTMNNVTGQIIPPVLTNDPKQRPMVGVWSTIYNYLVPMGITMVINVAVLPMFGGEYNVPMLAACCWICVGISLVLEIFSLIGVSRADRPESFLGINARSDCKVTLKDMWKLLKSNRGLQMYIVSQSSDKLASQTASQSIVTTMLYGILIGNMGLATIISMIAMLPAILFAIFGARYAGKHGNKESVVTWTWVCMIIALVSVIFFLCVNPKAITVSALPTAAFFVLTLLLNGAKMCVTTSNNGMMADIIDYELNRSGKYMPAAVTSTYSFIDKLISSLGAAIAAGGVALIGYTASLPQPTDPSSTPVFAMTMVLFYGLPIFGWVCTLVAMRFCPLSRTGMVEVQKCIAEKKAAVKQAG